MDPLAAINWTEATIFVDGISAIYRYYLTENRCFPIISYLKSA